ncbi:MAG TPA: ADP-ribosylglycohydrolase family protein [Paludibaculum sp.]|jgi:ADP-ribosylglycohydrolase
MLKRIAPLLLLLCLRAGAQTTTPMPAAELADKIRGGLLGQILGDLNGLKHEMKYIAEPGNVESYVPALSEGAWTDDDTDIEWVYLFGMERSKRLYLPRERISELWRAHINRNIWCSHKYLRQLMNLGIDPPLTGSVHLNPWAAFNLSGQFVSESWGLISPGMPRTAARLSTYYLHTSVDGEPIQAAQMFATMIATAFLTSDMNRILDAGAAALDPKSEMAQVLADVRRWHRENPRDWRAARAQIKKKYTLFPGDDIRDRNGVLLNGAATIAALLYGQGDFAETVRHAFNFGWDADNTAATSGTIVGVIRGHKWMMAQGWVVQDRFRNTSRDGLPDETITRFGDRLIRVAERNIVEAGGTIGDGVCQIRTERPANVEPRQDPSAQLAQMRVNLGGEIESAIAAPDSEQAAARAAYLAIALDLAPAIRQKDARGWQSAVTALSGYAELMQVLFYDAPGAAGERLRTAAVAAGLERPEKKAQK